MSGIEPFGIAIILPIAAGVYLAKLAKNIDVKKIKQNYWPCAAEREKLLKNTYHRELTKLEGKKLTLIKNNSHDVLKYQQNHLEAMLRSLGKVDTISAVVKNKFENQYLSVKSNLNKIKEAVKSSKPKKHLFELTQQTDSQLRKLTLKAHTTLADIEREATSELMTGTLQSLGYSLKTKGNILVGSSGELSIRAEILSGGNLTLDTRSFSGLSCHKEVARFENKLKEKGLVVRRLLSTQTKRKEGVLLTDPFPPIGTINFSNSEPQIIPQEASTGLKQEQHYFLRNQNLQKQRLMIKES